MLWLLAGLIALAQPVEQRAVWMHASHMQTPEECDALVERMVRASINVTYCLVWYWGGRAAWKSDISPRHDFVTDDYDPLGYLIQRCHERGIQVHAWFVNGSTGTSDTDVGLLALHPDWRVKLGPKAYADWWDLGRPEVRAFEKAIMLEVVRKYPIDGVHFDYIRYSGKPVCLCDHCRAEFKRLYGYDVNDLVPSAFPLWIWVSANPVGDATTARVLVKTNRGEPAIAVNKIGRGSVLLFNWHAHRGFPPACQEVLKRYLREVGHNPARDLLVYRPDETVAEYGRRTTWEVVKWLRRLGWRARSISTASMRRVRPPAVVVLACAYIMGEDTASRLVEFVRGGGHIIVIDGPVRSMSVASVRQLVGFSRSLGYYNDARCLLPVGQSELIPVRRSCPTYQEFQRMWQAWEEYRRDGVSKLVQSVFREVKAIRPEVAVTAAVFRTPERAARVLQDWPRWLREGFIDYVLPMTYVMTDRELDEAIQSWKKLDPELRRIIPGLSVYMRAQGNVQPRPPELVLHQLQRVKAAGARGVCFFSLHYLSDEIISALRSGPFAEQAKPYIPLVGRPGG